MQSMQSQDERTRDIIRDIMVQTGNADPADIVRTLQAEHDITISRRAAVMHLAIIQDAYRKFTFDITSTIYAITTQKEHQLINRQIAQTERDIENTTPGAHKASMINALLGLLERRQAILEDMVTRPNNPPLISQGHQTTLQ